MNKNKNNEFEKIVFFVLLSTTLYWLTIILK